MHSSLLTTPAIALLTLMIGCSAGMDSAPERSTWSRSGPPAPCTTSDSTPTLDGVGAAVLGTFSLMFFADSQGSSGDYVDLRDLSAVAAAVFLVGGGVMAMSARNGYQTVRRCEDYQAFRTALPMPNGAESEFEGDNE